MQDINLYELQAVTAADSNRTEVEKIKFSMRLQYTSIRSTLSDDIMKVSNIPFMTISRHIKFGSAGKLDNIENKITLNHFQIVIDLYAFREFKVTIIMANV